MSKTCCSSPAKPLLGFDEENGKFTVSEDALREIQTLKGPVRIVGAIGFPKRSSLEQKKLFLFREEVT